MVSTGSLICIGLVLGAVSTASAIPVTFQINMTSKPTATDVYIRGGFNGWGTADQLTLSDVSGVYTGTVDVVASPGTVQECKFYYNPGDAWESVANRQFVLDSVPQTLPLTSWNVSDWPAPNNNIKFQVDMSAQVQLGKFTNNVVGVSSNSYVRVSGGFNGWGASIDFTNDASAIGLASNIYSQTLVIAGYPGSKPGLLQIPFADWGYLGDHQRPPFVPDNGW